MANSTTHLTGTAIRGGDTAPALPLPVAAGIAIILALLLTVFLLRRGGGPRYKSRPLLTDNEAEFLARLEQAAPELRFHAQVAMSALLEPAVSKQNNARAYWSIFGTYSQKRIDYLAQRRSDNSILAVIELDDRSHDEKKDAARDAMLSQAGYKVVRWQSRSKPDRAAIRHTLLGEDTGRL